jgi:ABC-type amino acid transport system permease subunit
MTAASDAYERPKVSFWNNPKIRSIAVQLFMLLVIGFFAYEIVHNTIVNLTKRNIATGFEFLNKSAGFDIIQSLVEFSSASSYGQALIAGFLNTLLVSSIGTFSPLSSGFSPASCGCRKTGWWRGSRHFTSKRYAMCRCCCRCSSGMARC